MPHYFADGQFRVLAVEDDPGVRVMYRRTLNGWFDLDLASTLLEARECVRRHRYDVVILDLRMTGEDTVSFWRWLQETSPEAAERTLVISADPADPAFAPIVADREGWVVQKPVSPWDIRDILWEALTGETDGRQDPAAPMNPREQEVQ